MPYFWFDIYYTLLQRETRYKILNDNLKCCCRGKSGLSPKNTVGIHFPLSLDEYCNPALERGVLDDRNNDQVLLRYQLSKNEKVGSVRDRLVPSDAKLITVHQAWLWKIDDRIITAFPQHVADELIAFMAQGVAFENADSKVDIALLMAVLINTWDHPVAMRGSSEHIFNIFQKSITSLLEEVKGYLASDSVETLNMNEERRYYHEITDIREELSMIRSVLFEQEKVWTQFMRKTWPRNWREDGVFVDPLDGPREHQAMGLDLGLSLTRPQEQFERWKKEIVRLEEAADRVEKLISINLDLKQKHASMKEAHSTAIMSAAVFGFTLITIIFTPLSFIISLLALPVDRFQHHQVPSVFTDTAGMYRSHFIGVWLSKYRRSSLSDIVEN